MDLADEWAGLLRTEGAGYAGVALANIKHEFPGRDAAPDDRAR